MHSVKLNQIVDKVNQILNGADDCFDEAAGYVIRTDKDYIKVSKPGRIGEPAKYLYINLRPDGSVASLRENRLTVDEVIELLNKTSL